MTRLTESKPNPDPSTLTTEQLDKGMAHLKELFSARLEAMDKAIVLLQAFADKSPTTAAVALSVMALRDLTNEKFIGVEKQFSERDSRTDKIAELSKLAIDAALQAAKEAVASQNASNKEAIAKSETATAKQIDGIMATMQANMKGSDDKMNDMKDRLTLLEGRGAGIASSWGVVVGVIGMALAAAAIIISFVK